MSVSRRVEADPRGSSLSERIAGWLTEEGSTKSAGLLRIALSAIAWTQVGGALSLAKAEHGIDLLISTVFFAASSCMLVGWHGRAATAVTGLCLVAIYHHFGLGHGIDDLWRHQSWLLATAVLWLSLSPCSRSLSWDRVRRPRPERGSRWGLRLVAMQLSAVYLFGALDKMNLAFLSGARLEQIFAEHYFGAERPTLVELSSAPLAISVTALELALALGLWHARLRRPLILAGVTMHAAFHLLLPVGTFSVLSVTLYLAFVEPARVEGWMRQWVGGSSGESERAFRLTTAKRTAELDRRRDVNHAEHHAHKQRSPAR